MREPKFTVGQNVKTPKNLYKETTGVITEIEKIFQEVDERTGAFVMDGLATLEKTIQHIVLPYTFDGETLHITYPADKHTPRTFHRTAKFYGYAYTVKTDNMNSVFNEEDLSDNTVPTPELDKMLAVKAKSQTIGEFLEWLGREKNIILCTYDRADEQYYSSLIRAEQLLADYFGIDLDKAEKEKKAILSNLRTTSTPT